MIDAIRELARSLRQVHDLRVVLSRRAGHAVVPGAEVRWAAGGAISRCGTVRRRIRRLLLGVRDLHAGLPSGREDRGDQLARTRPALGKTRCAAAQSVDRPAHGDRAARNAGCAACKLGTAQPRGARARPDGHRDPPRRADAELRRHDIPAALTQASAAARRCARRRLFPRLRHQLLRAAGRRDGGRGSRAQRLSRHRAGAGLLRTPVAVERQLPVRPAPTYDGWSTGSHRTREQGCRSSRTRRAADLMLKREAHEILGIEDEDLKIVSASMYDLCEFLLRVHERGELRTDFGALPMTVPYHAPCQQRGHGIGKPALDLLALVPDLHMIELDVDCCGIAGTYGLKKEKYEISMAVGKRLFERHRRNRFGHCRMRQRDLPLADRARRRRHRGASDRAALPSLRARRASTRAGHGRCEAHNGQRVITVKRHAPRPVVEASPTGQAVMRIDDVLLSRGERGTWRIDLKIRSESGDRSLQIPIGKHRAIDRLAWELRRSDDPS